MKILSIKFNLILLEKLLRYKISKREKTSVNEILYNELTRIKYFAITNE